MAKVAAMKDLNKFSKMGVRVPLSLKRRIKRLALDLETDGVTFSGNEMTMEAVFAVAAMEVLALGDAERRAIFARRIPELIALFEAELPAGGVAPGEGRGHEGGIYPVTPLEKVFPTAKKTGRKKSGNGGEGA